MSEHYPFCTLIKRINDEMVRRVNNLLNMNDLTLSQFDVLLVLNLAENHRMTLKELERSIHVAQSTTAGIVSRLEKKELVIYGGLPNDLRVKTVQLTERGVEYCRMAEKDMEQAEYKLLSGLTDTERSIFLTLLDKVGNYL